MEKRHDKRVSDEEKVGALKGHLLEMVAVSVVCDELGVAFILKTYMDPPVNPPLFGEPPFLRGALQQGLFSDYGP